MDDHLWWQDGVIYQVYPRSFLDTNHDGIGDLSGVSEKLDYLSRLGVDAIWLSPFYPTPDADFGYDISNHTQVDARFGSMQDFDHLLEQAHRRGIRVILDLVWNHTSDQHEWFKESRSSRDNPKRDWYMWRDEKNNWQAESGGSGWEYDATTSQYYYHSYLPQQPDVNWRNPEVRKAQLDVVRFWLERGVDGFRLDVFNVCFKDAEFRDNPTKFGLRKFDQLVHLYDADQPEMDPLLNEIRTLLDKYPDTYAVGETFLPTTEKSAGFVGEDRLHAAFSFDFSSSKLFYPWKPDWLLKSILHREKIFQGERWPTTVMSNHDVPRAASRYSRSEDDTQARLAMTVLLTLRGTPFMYYGEEIGMRDLKLKKDQIMDPPGKRYWPLYKGRDGCRGPMQWDDSIFAGFSSVQPWLPVHPDHSVRNVAAQEQDPDSMLHFTRKLISLRKHYPALRKGDFSPLDGSSRNVLAYLRTFDRQTILVAMNFSKRKTRIPLEPALAKLSWHSLQPGIDIELHGLGYIELASYEICILISGD
jgi:alpha-glucosidase